MVSDLAAKAPLASPALTGTPTAPTPTTGDNTTKIATTAFVTTAVAGGGGGGGTWAGLTGDLTTSKVIPWDGGTVGTPDTGLSRKAAGEVAIGNGTAGDFTGSLLATNIALGLYSGGGQGHMGQINGITYDGTGIFPSSAPYGTAFIDIGGKFSGSPLSQSVMGINSALLLDSMAHNCFAVNGQIATLASSSANIGPGQLLCGYFEVDHNGSGTCAENRGCSGYSYQQGAGTITKSEGGYFESVSGYYGTSTGGISQNYGVYIKAGGKSGTIGNNDTTLFLDTPYTGATFTNARIGLHINDQSAGGAIPNSYAIKIEGTTYVELGTSALVYGGTNASLSYISPALLALGDGSIGHGNGNLRLSTVQFSTGAGGTSTDGGISRLGAASLAIGNGTAGDFSGSLKLTTLQLAASSAAPTSAGTAGTTGQVIDFGGFLYYCSVTGGVGSATWNKLTMSAV